VVPVDLTDLEQVVGQYTTQHNLIVAAGPLSGAMLARLLFKKNKLVTGAVVAGSAWLAIHALSGPSLKLMKEQFGYLASLLGG
jgi:hypothetical protein